MANLPDFDSLPEVKGMPKGERGNVNNVNVSTNNVQAVRGESLTRMARKMLSERLTS
jgi:hypothetical protein